MGDWADDIIHAGFDGDEPFGEYRRDWRPNAFTPEYLWQCRHLEKYKITEETPKAAHLIMHFVKPGKVFGVMGIWIPKSQMAYYKGDLYLNEWFCEKIDNKTASITFAEITGEEVDLEVWQRPDNTADDFEAIE